MAIINYVLGAAGVVGVGFLFLTYTFLGPGSPAYENRKYEKKLLAAKAAAANASLITQS